MIFRFIKNIIYEYTITAEQVVILDLIYTSNDELDIYINAFPENKHKYMQNLLRRGFIKEEEGNILLDEKGFEVINKYKDFNQDLCEEITKSSENEIPTLVDEYRELFNGLRLGAMGSKSSCINKMKKFLKANPKVTKEEIFHAVKAYIASLNNDYRYLQQADFFINKDGGSRLETWIEEIRKNDNPTRDWTTTIS